MIYKLCAFVNCDADLYTVCISNEVDLVSASVLRMLKDILHGEGFLFGECTLVVVPFASLSVLLSKIVSVAQWSAVRLETGRPFPAFCTAWIFFREFDDRPLCQSLCPVQDGLDRPVVTRSPREREILDHSPHSLVGAFQNG